MYKIIELAPNVHAVELKTPETSAIISLLGGQLLSWQVDNKPVFWQSNKAVFQADKAIRGGVPICWPWFGANPELVSAANHGFARQALWQLTKVEQQANQLCVVLELSHQHINIKDWPYPFCLTQNLLFNKNELVQTLQMTHQAKQPLPISFAFHNYFAVSHYQQIMLQGLEQQNYFCKYTDSQKVFSAQQVTPEIDAVFDNSGIVSLIDSHWNRRINIQSDSCANTVVWNPGQYAADVADIGVEQKTHFLCVEPATVKPILLAPAQTFTASQKIRVEPFYCSANNTTTELFS